MRPESTTPSGSPAVEPLAGDGFVLTVDVEEWFHTCLVPEFVDPDLRPRLARELDRLLPEVLQIFSDAGVTATFFVLGELAEDDPSLVRLIDEEGHEVASHGFHHLRVGSMTREGFRADVRRSKQILEDALGRAVTGYRAPEWSLRSVRSPHLETLAELGFEYDSSLAPYSGAGSRSNPWRSSRLTWRDGVSIDELPPLTFGGPFRLPGHGWTGRLASPRRIAEAAAIHRRAGGTPVVVVHPWELASEPTPGELTGVARLVHEMGRVGYRERFVRLLRAHPWSAVVAVDLAPAETVVEEDRSLRGLVRPALDTPGP